jgi:hypothetical protein
MDSRNCSNSNLIEEHFATEVHVQQTPIDSLDSKVSDLEDSVPKYDSRADLHHQQTISRTHMRYLSEDLTNDNVAVMPHVVTEDDMRASPWEAGLSRISQLRS